MYMLMVTTHTYLLIGLIDIITIGVMALHTDGDSMVAMVMDIQATATQIMAGVDMVGVDILDIATVDTPVMVGATLVTDGETHIILHMEMA